MSAKRSDSTQNRGELRVLTDSLNYCGITLSTDFRHPLWIPPGAPSHQREFNRTTRLPGELRPVSSLAEELARELGCPVEVAYIPGTREVLAVARPVQGREVRVILPVPPIAIRLMDNPFVVVKRDLLQQLRHRICQRPAES
jgi:hypothetical protein